MPQVSIIVPVYNVEMYLDRCVESLLAQTFSDYEIILVDDGAKDSSGAMCDSWAERDKRIHVVHKSNGGLSSARNAGLDVAVAPYVGFIDSDDYVDPRMFEILYRNAVEQQVDMSACGVCNVYGENGREVPQCDERKEFRCSGIEAFGHILVGRYIPGTICNKLIRREVIGDTRFPVGRLYEDAFFHNALMPKVESVYVTTEPLYFYLHRPQSITSAKFSHRHCDIVDAYQQTLALVEKDYPQILPQAQFRLQWANFTVLDKMLMTQDYRELDDFEPTLSFLRSQKSAILDSAYFSSSRKVAMRALSMSVAAYRSLLLRKEQRDYRQ